MDTISLVNRKFDSGQKLLGRLADKGFVVSAACWVKPVDEERWTLLIVTPLKDTKGSIASYRQLIDVLREMGDDLITSSDFRLLGEKDPISHEMMLLHQRASDGFPPRSGPFSMGGLAVEEIYVCPLGEFPVKIFVLQYPEFTIEGVCLLSFSELDPHSQLIVGEGEKAKTYRAKLGPDCWVAAPEGSTLDPAKRFLSWNFRGQRTTSSANDVWSFAKLELHGFRFLNKTA